LIFVVQVSAQGLSPASGEAAPQDSPPPMPITDTQIARGRYLVERVVMCAECHSSRDAHGHILADKRFKGGPIPFSPPWPNNWANRAPRIAGLPGYTDELIVRLLTQGAIDRRGHQLRLPMPRFHMEESDALAVAAYLRTIQ
jgi:mono/diheme cytochrome c family protein